MKTVFFTGKGGVGKSTNSAVHAVHLAAAGNKVLLNSIDPAHNLHDIFHTELSRRPKEVAPNLRVMETDLDTWVSKYLKEMEGEFKRVYKYMEAFNLHRYFKILKYSPGIEEYAVLLALEDTVSTYADVDYIIFDTPPTALTIKFLALPRVSLLWLRELSSFRGQILEKKEIITKIKKGKREVIKDPVLNRINGLIERYEKLSALFTDHEHTGVVIVLNHDRLSLAESEDIYRDVGSFGMKISSVILNKFDGDREYLNTLARYFKGVDIFTLPPAEGELTGVEALEAVGIPDFTL